MCELLWMVLVFGGFVLVGVEYFSFWGIVVCFGIFGVLVYGIYVFFVW